MTVHSADLISATMFVVALMAIAGIELIPAMATAKAWREHRQAKRSRKLR